MYNSSHQKKYIVITTINEPNSIVRKYYQWKGWEIIIVGDKKTSDSWHQENVTYLDIHAQQSMFPHLAKYIPFNTYTRKIFGYCYAIKNKADYIFETDDDNAPYPNAQQALEKIINQQKLASVKTLSSNTGWVNIYRHFTDKHIWPRGYPLNLINTNDSNLLKKLPSNFSVKIVQFLADKDPDVDAIYRMTSNNQGIIFDQNQSFSLTKGTYSPWNSQGTLWFPDAYPLMFLPLHVGDRISDMLRSYLALTSMWEKEYTISFQSPIIYQDRNVHNLLKDFNDELSLYQDAVNWVNLLKNSPPQTKSSISKIYQHYLHKLVNTFSVDQRNIDAYQAFMDESYEH